MKKNKSQIVTASIAAGTSGVAGYLHAITALRSGGAAVVSVYDGTDATGTEKWRIGTANTAGDSRSIDGLNIYCASGIYVAVTNAVASVEFSGC